MRRSWQFEYPEDDGAVDREAGHFHVEITPDREVVRVTPVGDIDMSTASELAAEMQELRRSGFARVILDLRGATFIDSTGLHVILEEHAAAKADGGEFAIVPGPRAVQRIFDVTGLDSRLPFVDGATASDGAMPRRSPL